MSPRILVLLFAALASAPALADSLYKSIDSAGNVTYSSTPPKGGKVEKVDVPPPPTEAEVQAAEERLKSYGAQANELESQRREKEAAQAAQQAEAARQREAQQPIVINVPADGPQPIYYPESGAGFPPGMPTGRPIPIQPRPQPR